MSQKIVTITFNPALDKSFKVKRIIPEKKLKARDGKMDPGGGGINVARVVHRLGGKVLALWSCGGPIGEYLKNLLDKEGVPQAPVPVAGITRENIVAFDESTTEQYRFGFPGAPVNPGELDRWYEEINQAVSGASFLVFSGSLPPEMSAKWYADLVAECSKQTKVIVDTKGDALCAAMKRRPFLIKPNANELGQIFGKTLEDDSDVRDSAARVIKEFGVEVVIVSLGKGGALVGTGEGIQHLRAPSVRIQSKVGAGDSTVGGIVYGLTQGKSLTESVRYGIAAGAATVMTEGTELCQKEVVNRLYQQITQE